MRAFNKLAQTFAAQVETLKRYRGGGEQTMPRGVTTARGGVWTSAQSWGAPEGERNGNYRHGARTKATIEALALHQIAELTSAWGNIAAKITGQSAHPATSRVLDPLQCPVLGLGEGDATALNIK